MSYAVECPICHRLTSNNQIKQYGSCMDCWKKTLPEAIETRTYCEKCGSEYIAGLEDEENRKAVLLRAALEFLKRSEGLIEGTVHYDETDCDVVCLIQEIEIELDL